MTDSGVVQAAQALRVYLATLASADRTTELSVLVSLIYQDRLNAVPLDQSDPKAAIDEVCQRFSDLIGDHLALETILLSVVGRVTGRTPAQVLQDIIAGDLGSYD
jgi:hypothetical protein